jgi:hypothetical protein
MNRVRIGVLAACLFGVSAVGMDCDGDEPAPAPANGGGAPAGEATSGDITDQVFGTWSCTADGRPDWGFEVVRGDDPSRNESGWIDRDTGDQLVAYVHLTDLYLDDATEVSFRNFEYKWLKPGSSVIDHLEEWEQSAAPNAQYVCRK